MITYDDFKKVELKTAKILSVTEHPSADRLYIVEVELGNEKLQVIAGVRQHYTPQELVGKNVVVVTNLEPATIRGVESKGMILAASDKEGLSILTLDKDMPSGAVIK